MTAVTARAEEDEGGPPRGNRLGWERQSLHGRGHKQEIFLKMTNTQAPLQTVRRVSRLASVEAPRASRIALGNNHKDNS